MTRREVRLVPMTDEQVERLQALLAAIVTENEKRGSRLVVGRNIKRALNSIVTAYEQGITEPEVRATADYIEARGEDLGGLSEPERVLIARLRAFTQESTPSGSGPDA